MTLQLNVQEAKRRMSQLLVQAEAGEDVVIARCGKAGGPTRSGGRTATPSCGLRRGHGGQFLFDPLPDDELARWE